MICTLEKMLRVDVLALSDEAEGILRLLAGDGSMHLIDHKDLAMPGFEPNVVAEGAVAERESMKALAESLMNRIGGRPAGEFEPDMEWRKILAKKPSELLEETRSELQQVRLEIERSFEERDKVSSEVAFLDDISEEMNLLHENGLTFMDVRDVSRLFSAYGVVNKLAMDRLMSRMGGEPFGVVTRQMRGKQVSILVLGDIGSRPKWEAALSEAGFRHREIPERFHKTFDESLEQVEMELWQQRDRLAELTAAFEKKKPDWKRRLYICREAMRIQALLLKASEHTACSAGVCMISGFVPASLWPGLRRRLEKNTPGAYAAGAHPADEAGGPKVPSRFRNPRFFRPFEMLVRSFGLPGYKDVDPTPLVAISFLLMFGMMFGDVGHGAMLAAIGAGMAFLPYRMMDGLRDLGRIIMSAGGAGICFGLLFGSVFGVEKDSVLPALWMRPSHPENLALFLGSAMALGAGVLSLGIVLSIVQAVRRKDVRSALIGPWSACSLAFYWGLLSVLGLQMAGRPIGIPVWILASLLALPIAMIGGGQLALHMADRAKGRRNPHGEAELATLVFEPVEVVMSLFSNSVSFLRVAAFGLAHASLTMAVLVVNEMTRVPGSDILVLPFEHLFVVVLEGLIVTIQCLRLEYYEFFSKFFRGDGARYAPLSVVEE